MGKIIKIIGLIGLMGLISPVGRLGAAPPPEIIITWQAQNYAPSSFIGKKLPTRGTVVNFALQLIDDGKLVDVSNKEVRWYANNNLINSGVGLNVFSYAIPQINDGLVSIRSVVIYQGGEVSRIFEVPVVDPEAVIDNSQLPQLKPYFYFFNVGSPNELKLAWEESVDSVTLIVQNPKNLLETVRTTIQKP